MAEDGDGNVLTVTRGDGGILEVRRAPGDDDAPTGEPRNLGMTSPVSRDFASVAPSRNPVENNVAAMGRWQRLLNAHYARR